MTENTSTEETPTQEQRTAIETPCVRCGGPIVLDEVTLAQMRAQGIRIEHSPGHCVGDTRPKPEGTTPLRQFTVRIEVEEHVDADDDQVRVDLMARFTAAAAAPSFSEAMEPGGPIAVALGTEWNRLQSHFALADQEQP